VPISSLGSYDPLSWPGGGGRRVLRLYFCVQLLSSSESFCLKPLPPLSEAPLRSSSQEFAESPTPVLLSTFPSSSWQLISRPPTNLFSAFFLQALLCWRLPCVFLRNVFFLLGLRAKLRFFLHRPAMTSCNHCRAAASLRESPLYNPRLLRKAFIFSACGPSSPIRFEVGPRYFFYWSRACFTMFLQVSRAAFTSHKADFALISPPCIFCVRCSFPEGQSRFSSFNSPHLNLPPTPQFFE